MSMDWTPEQIAAKKPGWNLTTADDSVLWRMNPKGERGIFMCSEHRDLIEREDRGF